jgi:hypothetical protein
MHVLFVGAQECNRILDCELCAQKNCTWCLSRVQCFPTGAIADRECPFSQRRTCCNTHNSCESCNNHTECGWCVGTGCRRGNATGDFEDYCAITDWLYADEAKCAGGTASRVAGLPVLLGVGLVVGAFTVVVGGVLLALFMVRNFQSRKAREALLRYEHAVRRDALPCDRCDAPGAKVICHTCEAFLCMRCSDLLHRLSFAAAVAAAHREGSRPPAAHRLEPVGTAVAAAAAAENANYTSFAALLVHGDQRLLQEEIN